MSVKPFLQKSSQIVLDFIFPPHCVNCKAINGWLCLDCFGQISFLTDNVCERCGIPLEANYASLCKRCQNGYLQYIDGIRSSARFGSAPIRKSIHFLKYNNHRALASVLGKMLVTAYHQNQLAVDVIIPVPLHPKRLKDRGFNQSELLGKEMSYALNLPHNSQALRRVRHTEVQIKLPASKRRLNVAEAFFCSAEDLRQKRVLLIDDVCTTGATLDACASALHQQGVASVWGLTVARAEFDD